MYTKHTYQSIIVQSIQLTDTPNLFRVFTLFDEKPYEFIFKVTITLVDQDEIRTIGVEDDHFWKMLEHESGAKIVKLVSNIYHNHPVDFPVTIK